MTSAPTKPTNLAHHNPNQTTKMTKKQITAHTTKATIAFATLAFAQSAHTMAGIAVEHGGYNPILAWITPVLIDGALVLMGCVKLALGKNAPWWLALAIWGSLALSGVLNFIGHGPLGLVAPTMLALSFESLLKMHESPASKAATTRKRKATAKRKAA